MSSTWRDERREQHVCVTVENLMAASKVHPWRFRNSCLASQLAAQKDETPTRSSLHATNNRLTALASVRFSAQPSRSSSLPNKYKRFWKSSTTTCEKVLLCERHGFSNSFFFFFSFSFSRNNQLWSGFGPLGTSWRETVRIGLSLFPLLPRRSWRPEFEENNGEYCLALTLVGFCGASGLVVDRKWIHAMIAIRKMRKICEFWILMIQLGKELERDLAD